MKIGIDASCIEAENRTGMHTYLLSILRNLPKIDTNNTYDLYFKNKIPTYKFINNTCFRPHLLQKSPLFFWTQKPLWNTFTIPAKLLVNKIDIFFSPSYTLPVFWFPIKSVVVLHDISYEAHPEWFPTQWLKTMQHKSRLSAQKASLIITNSEFCKKEIMKYYNIPSEKIYVVHPGISRRSDEDLYKRTKQSIKIDVIKSPYILSVGNLYPRRNTQGLVSAFKTIATKIKDYKLVIIGRKQENDRTNINLLIKETNDDLGSTRIIYKEYISDIELEQLYKHADLFVNLSNYEGFGCYSMLEAMIYGCPLIAVKTSSMPELIGDSGVYTSHDNIQIIGDTIYNVIKDGNLRKKMSRSGLNRIKLFSTENTTKQFINACDYVYKN
jgi:glycosyltransferase involved in cell wall biosynthesis